MTQVSSQPLETWGALPRTGHLWGGRGGGTQADEVTAPELEWEDRTHWPSGATCSSAEGEAEAQGHSVMAEEDMRQCPSSS